MWQQVNRAWRIGATGFSFLVFGFGGLMIMLVLSPIMHCLPGGETRRIQRTRYCIHRLFRLFVNMMRALGILTYEVQNDSRLKNARLVLANHPSLLDVVFLISLIPNANCVVKGPLTRNIFTRGPVTAAGYIVNESADQVVEAATSAFAKEEALIVFPEGTRTTPSQAIDFKRGAANLALRAGSDITPVLIYCEPTTLTKNEPWYRVPSRPVHYRFLVRDLFPIAPYSTLSPSVGARKLTGDLVAFFERELTAHG